MPRSDRRAAGEVAVTPGGGAALGIRRMRSPASAVSFEAGRISRSPSGSATSGTIPVGAGFSPPARCDALTSARRCPRPLVSPDLFPELEGPSPAAPPASRWTRGCLHTGSTGSRLVVGQATDGLFRAGLRGGAGMTRLLEIDAPSFVNAFAIRSLAVRHSLVGHPLFTIDAIAELADKLPPASVRREGAGLPLANGRVGYVDVGVGRPSEKFATSRRTEFAYLFETFTRYPNTLSSSTNASMR